MSNIEKEIRSIINKYSQENNSNTPDFILAQYIMESLKAFENAVNAREKWHGRRDEKETVMPMPIDRLVDLDPNSFAELKNRVLKEIPEKGSKAINQITKIFRNNTGHSSSDVKSAILGLKADGKIIINDYGNVSRVRCNHCAGTKDDCDVNCRCGSCE